MVSVSCDARQRFASNSTTPRLKTQPLWFWDAPRFQSFLPRPASTRAHGDERTRSG